MMQFFGTDHLKTGMKRRGVRGSAAMFVSRGLIFLLELAGTVVLARLLDPRDFGLVAMVTLVVNFAILFRDLGLSEATVWAEKTSQELVSNLFWITVAVGMALCLLLGALAPVIARFYGEPRLVAITLCLLPSLFFSSLMMQHRALLRRQMRFGRLAAVNTVAAAAALAVAVVCAAGGLGAWSLVVRQVAASVFLAAGMWVLCPWRPGPPRRGAGLRKAVSFGGNLSATRFLQYLLRNADNLLIGRYVGSAGLGFYTKAYSLLLLPSRQINNPLSTVVVPILSRLQNEGERFRVYYRKALGLTATVTVPLSVFAGVAAYDIIRVVLGQKWDPAARVFLLLAPAAICSSFNVATGWVYFALGRMHLQLRIKAVTATLTLVAMGIGVRWGVEGMAIAVSAASVVFLGPQLAYCYRGTFVSLRDFREGVGLPLLSSFGAGALVLLTAHAARITNPGAANLCWKAAVFFLLYMLPFVATRPGRRTAAMVADVVNELRRSSKNTGRAGPKNRPEDTFPEVEPPC